MFDHGDLQAEGNVPDAPKPLEDNAQDSLATVDPTHPSDCNLCLAAPPSGSDMGPRDNVNDTWMGIPC